MKPRHYDIPSYNVILRLRESVKSRHLYKVSLWRKLVQFLRGW